ncbi:hypothetical protein M8C21_017642 [Ambrosia artemisiifolia]|uniref:BHLH domain-containing protein n=1 Tax=Ambrosia artemisiifolia TaxID=4212 RepID=A0AAD5CGH7_AMBAR|nr:hypothetical protein M8C21_017642 [Ambrosia artemisiifolia]
MEKDGFFNNGIQIPQAWNSIFGMELETQVNEMNCSTTEQQLSNCFLNRNWDNSMDHSDPFESALSSIVSSPVNSHPGIAIPSGENVVLKELIGRLGSICNSGEYSPQSCIGNTSTNTSCYNTPLNSPPKLNLSMMDHHGNQIPGNLNLPIPRNHHQLPPAPFPADPGFVERAARLSCFGMNESEFPHMVESGKLSRVSSKQSFKTVEFPIPVSALDKKEESSLSEQNTNTNSNGRKRKAISKGKGKESQFSTLPATDNKAVGEPDKMESDAKRSKSGEEGNGIEKEKEKEEGNRNRNKNQKQAKENAKPEPPKDYIHVRARRGQATDSHSLAERVRREKISERMKFLQDLVPGCNKFLSMKLATINPRTDMNIEALLSKDARPSMLNTMNHLDATAQPFYGLGHNGPQNPLASMMQRGSNMKSSQTDGFGQMGFSQNQGSILQGLMGAGQMKVEL